VVTLKIIGAIAAGVSAICWIKAALITAPLPMAYLSGPPKELANRIESQGHWNGRAAWAAALAALCHGITLW
jgi:hypothetical protein